MLLCIICTLRKLRPARRADPEQQPPVSSDVKSELEDLHRFSFNSLLTLLAILTISGSKTLLPVMLALLVYTISLRLATSPCFVQKYPILSIFLHVVPLIGTFCMASAQLVLDMQSSPAVAVIVLLLSVLPFVTTILHHGGRCEETPLPIRMQDLPPIMSGQSSATAMSN